MKYKHPSQIKSVRPPQKPPSTLSMLGELRTLANIASLPFSFLQSKMSKNEGEDVLPIILIPGYGSDHRYMFPLSRYLLNLGYQSEGWGLGFNLAGMDLDHTLEDISSGWNIEPSADFDAESYKGEGGVPYLCDLTVERVRARAEELGSRVILIGWSLGGTIAREVARDLPDQVAQVITFGAPVIGGPKYTKSSKFFKSRGLDMDWIEREAGKRDSRPIEQPMTIIYSKSDAIVDWRAAVDKVSPNTKHFEVKASHLGMGFNREVWRAIRDALKEHR